MCERTHAYLCGDAAWAAWASQFGYTYIENHPVKLPQQKEGDVLVIAFDYNELSDKASAVDVAKAAANCGVLVGIHTFYPEDPQLDTLRNRANVGIATTHLGVLSELRKKILAQAVASPADAPNVVDEITPSQSNFVHDMPTPWRESSHIFRPSDELGDGIRLASET